ncbi:MAG TPA: DUF6165 family protein [Aliidongia sp.]|nr:DUF6165 family protein [Aliidongia sp.]
MIVRIDISIAEMLDRITICEVKLDHMGDPEKRRNTRTELDLLKGHLASLSLPAEVQELVPALRRSNDENFRQIDRVFACEAAGDFGSAYVTAARAAFRANAERARLKRQINLLLDSEIIEEKTY